MGKKPDHHSNGISLFECYQIMYFFIPYPVLHVDLMRKKHWRQAYFQDHVF